MDYIQYFSGLKKTIEGKDDYYFLVNDSNSEIRQHYDDTYENSIDYQKFIKSFLSKRNYLYSKNINYNLFVIPDKSVTARKYLPFETNTPKRIVDNLTEYIYDLRYLVDEEHILKNDTHISSLASLKITPYILSIMNNTIDDNYEQLIKNKVHTELIDHKGDLFFNANWSFPQDSRYKKNAHSNIKTLVLNDDYVKVDENQIPTDFRYVSKRESLYYKNENSISNKKALVLRDSSTNSLITSFIAYYREVFFYWDHWYFNKELVEWFKPDDVIEIRTERFLEKPKYPLYENDFKLKQNLMLNKELIESFDKKLHIKFDIKDFFNRIVDTNVELYLDDELIETNSTQEGKFDYIYDLSHFSSNKYKLRLVIKESDSTIEANVFDEIYVSEDFKKYYDENSLCLKGIDNTFFLINDMDNEILQHYYLNYKSSFVSSDFKASLDSKRNYLKQKNITFSQFIIPDKSIVLRDKIPFDTNIMVRHLDNLRNYYYDLADVVNGDDFLVNDTKLTPESSINIVSYILHKTFKQNSIPELTKLLSEYFNTDQKYYHGDLFMENSWTYPKDDVYNTYSKVLINDIRFKSNFNIIHNEILNEFEVFNNVKSSYYTNDDSISDKRALILCDKGIYNIYKPFLAYFRQVFFYHDFWYFNKNLIKWFNPDVIIEVKSERTLDNAKPFLISDNSNILIPVKMSVDMEINCNNELMVNVKCRDIRNLSVESVCKFFIDDDEISQIELVDGLIEFKHDVSLLNTGEHNLKVRLEEGKSTKAKLISKEFMIE